MNAQKLLKYEIHKISIQIIHKQFIFTCIFYIKLFIKKL